LLPFTWKGTGRIWLPSVAVVLAVWALATGCMIVFVQTQFSLTMAAMTHEREMNEWAYRFSLVIDAWTIFCGSALLAIPGLTAVLAARWPQVGGGDRFVRIILVIATGAMVAVAMFGLAKVQWASTSDCYGEERPSCLYAALMGMFGSLGYSRPLVLAVAGLATAVVLMRTPKNKSAVQQDRFSLLLGTLVFAIGCLAWGLVRPAAQDGAHPLPFLPGPDYAGNVDVPSAERCLPLVDAPVGIVVGREVYVYPEAGQVDAPVLTMPSGRVEVDGLETGRDGLRSMLLSKRELWMAVYDGKSHPGRVVFSVEPRTPMAVVAPLLDIARAAGYPRVEIALALPQVTTSTRTLGPLPRRRRYCQVPLPPDAPRVQVATWGELASMAQAGVQSAQ
jgi:hypothetical protein